MGPDRVGRAVGVVRDAALALVQDDRGVRVEDYLTALASATGESVIVDAGLFDIEGTDMAPGAAVFGDALNVLLSGDAVDIADADPSTVVGVLRDALPPAISAEIPSLEELYAHVAGSVGGQEWGTVATSVPPEHHPQVLPIRMAFELRPVVAAVVDELRAELGTDAPSRHAVCASALAAAIVQTAGAIEPSVGVRLALEVVFGMAKMVPMSVPALHQVADDT